MNEENKMEGASRSSSPSTSPVYTLPRTPVLEQEKLGTGEASLHQLNTTRPIIPDQINSQQSPQTQTQPLSQTTFNDSSILETIFNNPLRHLASHSTLNSLDSYGNSSHRRSRSHRRAGSTSTSATNENPNPRYQGYRYYARQPLQLRLSTNFEEQRHEGKPNLSITRNTRRFDPHYELSNNSAGWKVGESRPGSVVGNSSTREATGSRSNITDNSILRPESAANRHGHIRTESGKASVGDGTTLFEHHRSASLTKEEIEKEFVDGVSPSAAKDNAIAAAAGAEEDDETNYPGPLGLLFLSLGLMLCVFLISLDRTIITPAIPFIVNEFQSYQDIGWYGSAYLLTAASFQPMYGRIFTIFDIKWSYLFALGMFELGSLICGVAPNSTCLIVGRAIAGLGSAGILTGSFVVCSHAVPLAKRPVLTAIVGLMFGVGATVGPLLGGVFTDYSTWRWAFYFNLPAGGVTALALVFFFKPNAKHAMMGKSFLYRIFELDLVGNVIILGAAIQLFLALQYTEQHIPWSDKLIVGLLVGSFSTFVVFCVWMWWKADGALIPPRIIGQRTVAASCAVAFFLYSATLIHMFYLPFWFQAIQGSSATRSGVNLIPYVVANALFTLLAGIFVSKNGYFTIPATVGCGIGTVGCGLISMLNIDTGTNWIGYEICASAGIGMAIQQGFTAVQIVLPLDEVAIGTAAVVAFQSLGGAIFVSVGNSILQNSLLSAGRSNMLPGIDVQAVIDAGASAFRTIVTTDQLPALLVVYNDALRKAFICAIPLCGLACFSALFLEWRDVKDQTRVNEEKKIKNAERRSEIEKFVMESHRKSANSNSTVGGAYNTPRNQSIV